MPTNIAYRRLCWKDQIGHFIVVQRLRIGRSYSETQAGLILAAWNVAESGSARNAAQLAAMIRNLYTHPSTRQLIQSQALYSASLDEAVTRVVDFLRLWARFHFPRLLRGINLIQQDVLGRMGRRTGNYDFFAVRVENLFLDSSIPSMEEYGIPLEVARKLASVFATNGDVDVAPGRLRGLDVGKLQLNAFEVDLVRDAQEHA